MKSQIFSDRSLPGLIERIEMALEGLTKQGDKIIAIPITMSRSDSYFGVIFHDPQPDLKQPAVAVNGHSYHYEPDKPTVAPIKPHTEACWRQSTEPIGAFSVPIPGMFEHVPGGCVSIPDENYHEPKPWDDSRIHLIKHGRD